MSAQQTIGIALSKNGLVTVLGAVIPLLSGARITVASLQPILYPAGRLLEPKEIDITNIQVSNVAVSLHSLTQQISQPGPPPSCVFDIATHLGFHISTAWEEKGDTGICLEPTREGDQDDTSLSGTNRPHRKHHHQFRQYWSQSSPPQGAQCEGKYDHMLAFSFDMIHDTSTFTFHVTLKIDPASNTWQCSATSSSQDVQPDLEHIKIPDGTYLPIHSNFPCIRDKVYSTVHDTIAEKANFAGTLQTVLTNYLNKIPTKAQIAGFISFDFAPTALTFFDKTDGLAVGFNGTLSFGEPVSLDAEPGDPIVIPLPVPDPAHTVIIRLATHELQLVFFGLYGKKLFSRRFDASSVPNQSVFNTYIYKESAPPLYNWAPSASIILYLDAATLPKVLNIEDVWVVTEDALATAGITPQTDSDAYRRLQSLVEGRGIYTTTTSLKSDLEYYLTANQFKLYGNKLITAARTQALPINAEATARVCIIAPDGSEKEAFVVNRTSTFLGTTFAVNTVTSTETGNHLITFDFAETSATDKSKKIDVPLLTESQAHTVLDTLMGAVDHYVQNVGKAGLPIPTLEGFAINKASVNFIPSKKPPYSDAIIEVVADLTVNEHARLWREPEQLLLAQR